MALEKPAINACFQFELLLHIHSFLHTFCTTTGIFAFEQGHIKLAKSLIEIQPKYLQSFLLY